MTPSPVLTVEARKHAPSPPVARARGNRERTLPLTGLLFLATVLRLYTLSNQFWFDEVSAIVNNVRRPFADIVLHWAGLSNHALAEVLSHASVVLDMLYQPSRALCAEYRDVQPRSGRVA